jgi:hypothetical protein
MSNAVKPDRDKGYIVAGEAGEVISKYTFQTSFEDPKSGIAIPFTLNINSDVSVPSFKSPGAPDENGLEVEYDRSLGRPNGFSAFNGTIGGGRLYLEVPSWKFVVKGPIVGGPKAGIRFVGNGSWLSA